MLARPQDSRPVAREDRGNPVCQRLHQRLGRPLLAELHCDVEWIRSGVGQPVDDASNVFDLYSLEPVERVSKVVAADLGGHAHGELVDRPAPVALEDVDPDHIGSDVTE